MTPHRSDEEKSEPGRKVDFPVNKREWRPSVLPGQVVLVTTIDERGQPNVAPKSWVSMAAFGPPPKIMFGCTLDHATARNALASKEFVINIPGEEIAERCWACGMDSKTRGPDRFSKHRLTPIPSTEVRPPRVAECPGHLECRLDSSRQWDREVVLFGNIVAASIDSRALEDDLAERYRLLAPFFFLEIGWTAPLGPARQVEW